MARTLEYIHSHRVLVADIASRDFLLDSDLSLRLCDFSEASILPLDTDMASADDHGFSTRIDIGLLGAVMYEVVTGVKCAIDLFHDNHPTDGRAHWPERRLLPSTENVCLGWLTTEEFQMRCVCYAHCIPLSCRTSFRSNANNCSIIASQRHSQSSNGWLNVPAG